MGLFDKRDEAGMERAREAAATGGRTEGSAGYERGLSTLSASDRAAISLREAEAKAKANPPPAPDIKPLNPKYYRDMLSQAVQKFDQGARVRAVGTTNIPYEGSIKSPYDYESLGGLAEFGFDLMSGPISGLTAVGQSLAYNKERQDFIKNKIMSKYDVDAEEAQNIMDDSGLNVTDLYSGANVQDVDTRDRERRQTSGGLIAGGTGVPDTGATDTAATAGGSFANWEDIFGGGADYTETFPTTPEGSAMASISQQESQRNKIKELYAPYYEGAIDEALPQIMSMITGEGELDYTPSKLYDYQKEEGERNIRRQMAARGISQSSGARDVLEEFRSDLTAEEADRLYGGRLSTLQLGSGAAGAVGAASRTLGGTVGSIYSLLGGQKAGEQVALGESRQSIYQGLANTLSGLSEYMASR